MANKNIKVTDLDFDTIKNNLREYLSGKAVFTDYDFEGSALSVLLDVLAYNTHYNAYYVNMVANEMFLDSAFQRDSVVSIAKHLGYTPKSKTGASASVTLELSENSQMEGGNDTVSVTIPKYEKFDAVVDGKTYTFYTMNSYSSTEYVDSGDIRTFTISGVSLKEGNKLSKTFVVNDNSLNAERYLIPNSDVDTSTIVVKVKESLSTSDTSNVIYTKNDGIKDYTSTDKIYFLQEVEAGKYEIFFGDGVYGNKLEVGNVITVDYITTNGIDANGAGNNEVLSSSTYGFTPISSTANYGKNTAGSTRSLSVVAKVSGSFGSVATGGSDVESIESIKYTAPINFQAQNRALTANDYKSIILTHYANVDSIRVWGGEDNTRPEYGRVYIVVKPKGGTILTQQNITDIKDILKKYKPIGITVDVKSPEYLYLTIDSTVTYNPNIAVETEGTLKSLIVDSIMNYNNLELSNFDSIFRYSKLSGVIDDTDASINSNKTTIGVRQHKTVSSEDLSISYDVYGDGTHFDYTVGGGIDIVFDGVDLKSPVNPGTFVSDNFKTLGRVLQETNDTIKTVYYKDDGIGNIDLLAAGGNVVSPKVATIDYTTGLVSKISPVKIIEIISGKDYVKFSGDVVNQDIYSDNTQIILFEEIDITVTMKAETI
tara:strand:+ start:15907 stop:17871 length:1965 start_codon:yes stop_codon:yes gene_type:complete